MPRGPAFIAFPLGAASVIWLGWLVGVAAREPDYGRPSRLEAAVDGGSMEAFLDGDAERARVLKWVRRGAPEAGWPGVSEVFEARCVTCHSSGDAPFEMLALDRYAPAAAAAAVRPVLEEKITGGTMGEYLETAEEQSVIVSWIGAGAPEPSWPRVREILAAHCVQCHNPEGVAGIPSLVTYPTAARLARLPEPRRLPLASYALPAAALLASLVLAVGSRRP